MMRHLLPKEMLFWPRYKVENLLVRILSFLGAWVFISGALGGPALAASDLHWSFDNGAVLQTEAGTELLGVHLGISPELSISSVKEPTERQTVVGLGISRARLQLRGRPVPLGLAYRLSLAADNHDIQLKDAWIDAALGHPSIWLRAGQMRRSFSRQGLTPYYLMVLPDRPLTEDVFVSGRDSGLMLHASPWSSFEWALAFFMGDYESPYRVGERIRRETIDESTGKREAGSVLLRLARRPKKGSTYDESDSQKLPFRWSVGLSLQAFLMTEDASHGALQGEVDIRIAVRGFNLTGAFFVATEQDGDSFEHQGFQAAGYTLQSSYLIGTSFEPSVRFTHLVFSGSSTDVKDVSAGFALSFYGGLLRWLNRVGMTTRDIEGGYRSDVDFRSHLQLRY